jgi:hypothetical protein
MKQHWLEDEGEGRPEPLSSICFDIDFEIVCLERYHDIIKHLIEGSEAISTLEDD